MKSIITVIITIVCIVAGGFGGNFLRTMTSGSSEPEAGAAEAAGAAEGEKAEGDNAEKKEAKASKPDKKDGKDGKDDKDGKDGKEGDAAPAVIYYKFTREFVVPIIRNGRVSSLVILNLNLEADASMGRKLYDMEPKLRDNIMTTLITLSNDGTTFESMTSVKNYESIRSLVLQNLGSVVKEGITNVLIVDLAKQDI
jgi:flagellar basal body-associated protein FliL